MNLGSAAGYFATTRNVLCTVNKGDHVWIQTDNHYTDNYFNDLHGGVRSSFIGLFIQQVWSFESMFLKNVCYIIHLFYYCMECS